MQTNRLMELRHLIFVLSEAGFSHSKIKKIFDRLGDDASIKTFNKVNFVKEGILKEDDYKAAMAFMSDSQAINIALNYENKHIRYITKFDDEYPEKLRILPDCPFILYYMGDLSLLSEPSLSIVGTRSPTNYGRDVTERITKDIASSGIVIVSGLALGTDSIAHRSTLEVGGKTIAVLGGGFYHIYPDSHRSLAREIYSKGLILTEYKPDTVANKYNFPVRNRIIAGLGDGILITEAELKSGTIHTKEYGLEYGKNIYALPGNILSNKSDLPNEIIKTGQAQLITSGEDILKDYNISKTKVVQQAMTGMQDLSEDEGKIVEELKKGTTTIEDLTKNVDIDIKILNTCLTTLEISGIIKRLPGGYISLG